MSPETRNITLLLNCMQSFIYCVCLNSFDTDYSDIDFSKAKLCAAKLCAVDYLEVSRLDY